MTDSDLRAEQAPLKEKYENDPDAAKLTLSATGEEQDDRRACDVDIGRAIYEAQLHEGAGGPGTAACSGDLLLGALAACSQLTAQAVAETLGIDAEIRVEVTGDLDLRGTLGVDEQAPVGFESLRLDVTVEGDLDEETRATLRRYTEQCCVVYQTLESPSGVDTAWSFDSPDTPE